MLLSNIMWLANNFKNMINLINIKVLLFAFLLSVTTAFSQQAMPVEMIFAPQKNNFAISGIGGGNLDDFKTKSASGQLVFDINMYTKETEKRKNTTSISVKYNPTVDYKFSLSETINMNKIAFIDNQYMLFTGLHYYSLKAKNVNSKNYYSFFSDFAFSPYSVESSNPENSGFFNFNSTTGFQSGMITNTSFGIIGISLALQGNYIYIYDKSTSDNSFDELLGFSDKQLSRNYIGTGGKLTIQINDFAIYLELRRYYPLDNTIIIDDFSNRPIFSIGGVATGTIFRNKK